MKNANFQLEDDENLEDKIEMEKTSQTNQMNKLNIKLNNKQENNNYTKEIEVKKKKKVSKKECSTDHAKFHQIPFEEQEVIEFVLMDFRQPEELNKFVNMKSLTLVQQNIKSINVNL